MPLSRREFLAGALLGGAALSLPGLSSAATTATARFAAGLHRYPWLAGWQDATGIDGRVEVASVEGQLPRGLRGSLYRTGPGRFSRNGTRYRHWFDGDGLIRRWRISDAGVEHRARFAATPKFLREESLGRFVRPAAGSWIDGAESIRNSDDMNTANTGIVEHAGEMYALWEGGSALAFDARTLATSGFKGWRDDLRSMPFSAHPMHDTDGSLWNFGLSHKQLFVWHIGADGGLRSLTPVALPFAGYLHAFSMSPRYLAFVLMPFVPHPRERTALFESLQWETGRGCRALVVDKTDPSKQRWFGLPAGAAYHFGPAIERGDELLLQACWSQNAEVLRSPFESEMQGRPLPLDARSRLLQIRLDLRRGRADVADAVVGSIDFPVWSPAQLDGSMFAIAARGDREHGYMDMICAFDPERGETDRFDYGDGVMAEEHRFVPAPAARRPRQGWLIGSLLDYRRQRSGIAILDAENLAAGPLAMAWLPRMLPLGFHGWFSAET